MDIRRNIKLGLVICFAVFVSAFLFTNIVLAEGGYVDVKLNVPLPGLGDKIVYTPGNANMIAIYIKALYKFFVGIAGILAVVMIALGGVMWLFSGGSAEKIGKAKEIIMGAVIGLILALGSYMILNTINPKLVDFSEVKITGFEKLNLGFCEPDDYVVDKQSDYLHIPYKYYDVSCGEKVAMVDKEFAESLDLGKEEHVEKLKKIIDDPNNYCIGQKCDGLEVCADKIIGGPICVRCKEVDDDLLRAYGLPESERGCNVFTPPSSEATGHYHYCGFTHDAGVDWTDDVCIYTGVSCEGITSCEGYQNIIAVSGRRSEPLRTLEEGSHLRKVCIQDINGSNSPGGVCHLKDADGNELNCRFGGTADAWTCTTH